MTWIPVSDPPPPDDHHTWAAPAPDDCPDCECCTARLCAQAIEQDSACHLLGSGPDFDLAECPCWRRASAARARLETTPTTTLER